MLIDYCQLHGSTVEIAMSYIDHYIGTIHGLKRCNNDMKHYQFACMTFLHTAIEIHEPLGTDIPFMTKLQNIYTKVEFVRTRCTIFSVLQ